jgi:spore coat protein U-like protein
LPGQNLAAKKEEIMKKIFVVAAVAVIVIAMASGAFAAGTDTAAVTASASVSGVCNVVAGGNIPFGLLDQVTGAAVPAVVTQPQIWCTKDLPYTITDDNGANALGTTYRLKASGSPDYIPYTFTYTSLGSGAGKSTNITPAIAASIAAGAYADVPADSYADTVTLTITY